MENLAFTGLLTGLFSGEYRQTLILDPLKLFKGFISLKISLKTSLKTIKNNFFKERGFFQNPYFKNTIKTQGALSLAQILSGAK